MKEEFTALCPYCNNPIEGNRNWEQGKICIQGFCHTCRKYILEDETDWKGKQI